MALSGLPARRGAQDGLGGRSSIATPSGGPDKTTEGRVWRLFRSVEGFGR